MNAAFWAMLVLYGSEPPGPPTDARAVMAAITENIDRFQTLPGFYISYTMTYEHLRGKLQFSAPLIEAINARRGLNAYASSNVPSHNDHRQGACNGTLNTELFRAAESQMPVYKINVRRAGWGVGMQYYTDHLFHAGGYSLLEDPDDPAPHVNWKGPDYWLPTGFERNAERYRLLPNHEAVDGADCVVIEWPGRDRIWVDPGLSHTIRRRDFRRKDGMMRDRVYLREFRQVADGLWLPKLIVHEQYCTLEDRPSLQNQVSGVRTIRVKQMRVEALPDETFVVEMPEEARVQDYVRDVFYNRVGSGDDPVARAEAEVLRRLGRSSSFWTWLKWILPTLLLAGLAGVAYRRWRRPATA